MSAPVRVQRKRTKGWTMPENTVYVGRPSRWGNWFRAGDLISDPVNGHNPVPGFPFPAIEGVYERTTTDGLHYTQVVRKVADAADAVNLYRRVIEFGGFDLRDLRGKNLACWCPLVDAQGRPVPCHADVLLELANGGTT